MTSDLTYIVVGRIKDKLEAQLEEHRIMCEKNVVNPESFIFESVNHGRYYGSLNEAYKITCGEFGIPFENLTWKEVERK